MTTKLPPYIILVLLALAGFLAWYFQGVLLVIVLAVVFSIIGRPIMHLLGKIHIRKWRLPRGIRAVITIIFLYLVFMGILGALIPVFLLQARNLENVQLSQIQKGLREPIQAIEEFGRRTYFYPEGYSLESYLKEQVASLFDPELVTAMANNLVSITGDFFISLFAVTFITFFFLKEKYLLRNIILVLTPDKYSEKINHMLESIRYLLTRYFVGVLIEVLLVGGLISLGLSFLGIEGAAGIGFFAGIFNVIPYLGPVIGIIIGILLTALDHLDLAFFTEMLPLLLKVLSVFLIVQLIDNMIFQPFIYSSSVKAHPLEIFLVIMMAGTMAGAWGMIIAIPSYTVLRVIAKEFFNRFKVVQSITRRL